jgi:site-specific DNA-methyltransferase (adenine-specific)
MRPSYQSNSAFLYLGDCLEVMPCLEDGSIDMVLCDLPYGTTQNKWDAIVPFEPMWAQFNRLCAGAVVLFAAQPFTSALVMSNAQAFGYSLVYRKTHATGHLNANRRPMREHEDILVFCQGKLPYFPQMMPKNAKSVRPEKRSSTNSTSWGNFDPNHKRTATIETKFPTSVLTFSTSPTGGDKGLHPTQKPVALNEYLIRTYTCEGATILDATMGSGSTGVACMNTGRRFVGIERDAGYFAIAERRVQGALAPPHMGPLFAGRVA